MGKAAKKAAAKAEEPRTTTIVRRVAQESLAHHPGETVKIDNQAVAELEMLLHHLIKALGHPQAILDGRPLSSLLDRRLVEDLERMYGAVVRSWIDRVESPFE